MTHFHPDHVGASDVLHDMTGAAIYCSSISAAQAPGVWGSSSAAYHDKLGRHLVRHGMPIERVRVLDTDVLGMERAVSCASLQPYVRHELHIGGRQWRIIDTPGHADGHVSLFDAHEGLLIAGDHLLEFISPAVGKFPDHAEDPLGLYLDSLDRVAQLNAKVVLPGHGLPFSNAQARCSALQHHHQRRLEACITAVTGRIASTWEVARSVFGVELAPHDERFAVTETLAHLARAQQQGLVNSIEPNADATAVRWQKL